jgi:acyl carrier protein
MLIDDRAISQSEHSGLFYEAANGTKFIGTPSAGANGDVTGFTLPGGIHVNFTGHDIRHADGRQLQRIGLQPDVVAAPTRAGIREGKDEVLERAIRFLDEDGRPRLDPRQASSTEASGEPCTQDSQAWKGLLRLLEEQFGEAGGKVSPETNLIKELDLDEMELVQLILAVEEELHVEIPDEIAETLVTAGDWCGYIAKQEPKTTRAGIWRPEVTDGKSGKTARNFQGL